MISISARPENSPRRVRDEVGLYAEYLQGLTFNCMKHEAALCAVGFARFTPPFKVRETVSEKGKSGIGKDDEAVGNAAVAMDVRSIFRPTDSDLKGAVDDAYGSVENFQKWKRRPMPRGSNGIIVAIWKDQDIQRAYEKAKAFMRNRPAGRLLDNAEQMRRVHDAQRRAYRGRITRNRGPSDDVKRNPYLVDTAVMNRYIQERQKRVGWLKSAWAYVVRKIGKVNLNGRIVTAGGGTRMNQWITRHGSGGGGAVQANDSRKSVRIINFIGDEEGVSSSSNVIPEVINWRNNCLNSHNIYQKEVDKSVRLWNAGRIKARNQRIYGN